MTVQLQGINMTHAEGIIWVKREFEKEHDMTSPFQVPYTVALTWPIDVPLIGTQLVPNKSLTQ